MLTLSAVDHGFWVLDGQTKYYIELVFVASAKYTSLRIKNKD